MAKVADFGLSSRLFLNELKERMRDRAVELPTWLAPEVLSELPYTEKSDVYAFGVILWELYTGEHPFLEFRFKYQLQLEEAIKGGIRPIIPGNCPVRWAALLARCWDSTPSKRPTFESVCAELDAIYSEDEPRASGGPELPVSLMLHQLTESVSPQVSPKRSPHSPLHKSPLTASPTNRSNTSEQLLQQLSMNPSPSLPPMPLSGTSWAPSMDLRTSQSLRENAFVNGTLEQRIALPSGVRVSAMLALGEAHVIVSASRAHTHARTHTHT